MGTVTVIYGHAYDGKHQEALAACLNFIRRNEGDHCLYLVRSDVRVQQLRNQVLDELGGYFHFPVATLPDYVKRLYRQVLGARREISALEQALLIEDIFRQRAAEAGPQFCFHRFRQQHGVLKRVQDFLINIRRYGIVTPQHLEKQFQRCSPRRQALYAELARIMERYTARLDEQGVIDETGIFLEMARRAETDQLDIRTAIPSPELLVLEGYYELTLPEQQIFRALSRQFERSVMTLDTPQNPYAFTDDVTTPKPFRIFRELFHYIQTSGFSVQQSLYTQQAVQDDARLTVIDGIFKTGAQYAESVPQHTQTERISADPTLDFFTVTAYRNKSEEVTAIAREIRQLFRQHQVTTLRDIGVTFPVVEQYEHVITEIFPSFGIPFTMVQGRSLAASPVVVTIFSLLEVVLEDYGRESLSTLLTSPFVAFTHSACEEEPSPSLLSLDADSFPILDSFARMLGIMNGKAVWQERLAQYYDMLVQQSQESAGKNKEPNFYDAQDTLGDEAESETQPTPSGEMIEMLKRLLPTLSELFEVLSGFETDTPCPVEAWIDLLTQRIRRFQIPQRVLQAPNRKIREIDAAAFHAMLTILDTLRHHAPASAQFSLKEFYDLLRRAVQQETYYPPEHVEDAVWIMGHLDTRHVQFQYLFFGGLVERDFPGKVEPNIFFSEQETELFGLPTYRTRVQETDHLFYANLLNATQHLYLSYPLQDGDTDLLKAVYIENILRWKQARTASNDEDSGGVVESAILPGTGRDASAPESIVERYSLEQIYTDTDLLEWIGAARVQPDFDPQLIGAVLRWLVAERGPRWGRSFIKGIQAYSSRNAEQLGAFDGMLTSAWAQRFLRRRYERHQYSPSEFDLYARCPIRFLFQRLLLLFPLQEVPQDIPASEIGDLLHRIVYRFYAEPSEIQAQGREGNVDVAFLHRKQDKTTWLQEAKTRLRQIVQEELAMYAYSGVFWDRFRKMLVAGLEAEIDHNQGLLATFAEQEASDDDVMLPWFVHANFGRFTRQEEEGYLLSDSPLRIGIPDDHGLIIAIRGQIDRIDVERSTDAEVRRVVVYDYKTGSLRPIKKIQEGMSFQLPLYLLAVQEFLGEKYEVVAGGYYQLKSPTEIGKKAYLGSKEMARYLSGSPRGLLATHDEFHQVLEQCKGRVIQIAGEIRSGSFHPSTSGPQEAGCGYCPYQQICRVDHQRMKAIVTQK